MKRIVVIPARFGSKRFPGKPLKLVLGRSLLYRVWRIATASELHTDVVVATDNDEVAEHSRSFGATVALTSVNCRNGTERTYAAIDSLGLNPDLVINLQGDAVLTPPWVIDSLFSTLENDLKYDVATPALPLTIEALQFLEREKEVNSTRGTTVVCDLEARALYFSKRVIPYVRVDSADEVRKEDSNVPSQSLSPVRRHIGTYCYRFEVLKRLAMLPPSKLELIEGLEQLRALENGIGMKVVDVDYRGRSHWSIDHPDDVAVVEEIIEREGELVA